MTEPRDAPPPDDDESTEEPRGAGRLIARFFLLPLLVVGAAVGVFLVFNLMTFERRSPRDYLQEVRGGTANRRWQAAFELSRSLPNLPPEERAELTAETLRIFEGLSRKRPEDAQVRRYLVLVLGRLGEARRSPGSRGRHEGCRSRHASLRDLGSRQDRRQGGPADDSGGVSSEDAGARKMAAYVLGQLGDPAAIPRLKVLAEDRVADVRWNAAIALAELGDATGLPVLRSMIDRDALARQARDLERPGRGGDGQRAQGTDAFEGHRDAAGHREAREGAIRICACGTRRGAAAEATRGDGAKP